MSDTFADLWNTSVPQKKPQTLSSLAQQQQQSTTQQLKPQGPDLFALLSSTSSSSSNPARASPSIHSNTHSNTSTPPPTHLQNRPQPRPQPQKSTTDAFSDLFSTSSSSSNQNLTIAQRSALVEKQRKEAALSQRRQEEKEKSAWAGLDSLSGNASTANSGFPGLTATTNASKSSTLKPVSSDTGIMDDDDWGLGDFGKPAALSQHKSNLLSTTTTQDKDDWDFDSFGSGQAQSAKSIPKHDNSATKSGGSLLGFDDFSSPSTTTRSQTRGSKSTQRADSPSNNFDFGNREDALLGGTRDDDGGGDDEDEANDFMSVFNRPPKPKPSAPSRKQSSVSPPSSSPAPVQRPRTGSPPPHILGQVVEMGFSIPKARAALLANNNDVQAAIDQLLVSEGGYTGGSGRGTPTSNTTSRNTGSPSHPQPQNAIPRRRDREPREREGQPRRGDASSPVSSMSGTGSGDIQAQAEQLFNQASEIGRGMFSKASAFWKEKKDQVQKVVVEHRSSSAASGSERGGNGRPKWMQQQQDGDDDENEPPKRSTFRDDIGGSSPAVARKDEREKEPEVWIPRRKDRQRDRERQRAREREGATVAVDPPPPPSEVPEIDLFAPTPISAITQPDLFDSGVFQTSSSSPAPSLHKRPRQQQSRPAQAPKLQRDTSTVQYRIASLKSEANAAFKLGQFGNAETLYTRAIDSLSGSGSSNNNLYFVLLLNNRANARMKNGDVGGAVKDCDAVVGLITTNRLELSAASSSSDDFDSLGGGNKKPSTSVNEAKIDWDPNQDLDNGKLRIPISPGGDVAEETVDLAESLIKAIKRRAEAYEGMEKWNKAKNDWEWLRSVGWVRENMRGEAGRGVGRCARMVDGGTSGSSSGLNGSISSRPQTSTSTPKTKPRPSPRPTPVTNNKHSEALQALRTSTAQAEAEDQAKHELKDSVDAKLSTWKSGKETNIRALLASLDMVLWEELLNSGGAVKVGMHELVTPAQVKVKYMKAVAKVHPDKLNVNNSTLEQRMIAQGVFGALNEAWNAFKQ